MEEKFNQEGSLSLISEMINRAQNNIQKMYSMIFWGYVTASIAIVNYVLINTLTNPNQSFWVWLLMIPAGVISYFIKRREENRKLIKTHLDKIVGMLWFGFIVSYVIFMAVIFTVGSKNGIFNISLLINPAVLAMVGMGLFATATIFRIKMLFGSATLTWAGSVVCAFLAVDLQFIVFAICIIFSFVIPGHILNRKANRHYV